jgi:hypothetical protein
MFGMRWSFTKDRTVRERVLRAESAYLLLESQLQELMIVILLHVFLLLLWGDKWDVKALRT